MKTNLQRVARGFSVLALFLCFVLPTANSSRVHAADTGNDASVAKTPVSYTFTARPGDSLSRFVRKALQLYSDARQLQVSPAAAMYIEANTVLDMGTGRLAVGQSVAVPAALLQQYVGSSRNLSAAQLAAWQDYAETASFDTSDIPVQSKSESESAPSEPSAATPSPDTPETGGTPAAQTSNKAPEKKWSNWLYAGAAGLIIAFYLFNGRDFRKKIW